MAKGKSSNPMDAYRKAQRAKELKKNKESRTKAREVATLKKDVGPLEAEVRKLTAADQAKSLDKNGQARLAELREEVTRIKKAKEEYVKAHPEHRKFVYAHEEAREQARKAANASSSSAGDGPAYDKHGRLRDPTRSVYYDPVFNPFGAPPPGMPYLEKPAEGPEFDDEGSSSDEDSDDDIAMPEGPAPGAEDAGAEDSDSDDSIVMPEGTPPPEARLYPVAAHEQVPPPPMPSFGTQPNLGYPQQMPPTMPTPFPPGFQGQLPPQMAMGYAQFPPVPYGGNGFNPPPPRGFFPNAGNQPHPPPGPPRTFRPPPASANLPQRPLGVVNDPLSDTPNQTFQAHRQAQREEAARDAQGTTIIKEAGAAPPPASAEISAAPQLRDLRKEAAIFVPRVAKKKKTVADSTVITSAPAVPEESSETADDVSTETRQDGRGTQEADHSPFLSTTAPSTTYNPSMAGGGLMSKLSGVLGTPALKQAETEKADEYKTFLAGLGKLEQ
ncbi:hypothetical protein NliqN6_4316 [Naganishia liquefaciens]|uniref:Wbp11/ELF5/Saf1 N-terminal domain-containing protein n=1 Tax=Naganishia liquefaciens TaxID=104408 RepID=A0A8H3TVN2_9TREE|nr:hypothetical protein NliqN6_4316 [Naganishia liquefaciens]